MTATVKAAEPTTVLDPRAAFVHVIAVFRAFATALGASEQLGLPTSDETRSGRINDEYVREFGIMARDSLLMNGRNAVMFLTHKRGKKKVWATDVLLEDFGLAVPPAVAALDKFERPISVHVVHITAWRDPDYRATHVNEETCWVNWDHDTTAFGDAVLGALNELGKTESPWSPLFAKLHTACEARRADPTCHWPDELAYNDKLVALIDNHVSRDATAP